MRKRKFHRDSSVHRKLSVDAKRPQRGLDVWRLRRALLKRADELDMNISLKPRGMANPHLIDVGRRVAKALGVPLVHEGLTQHAQEVIRDPSKRNPAEKRRSEKLSASRWQPRIITAKQLGLSFRYVWGSKGTPTRGAGHYTAGHRAANTAALKLEMRADHNYHKSKGWGGLSYEAMIADDGTIGFGNPVNRMSAAVANMNTGTVNICCPGTTGHRMTTAQKRSVKWLLDNWHTSKVPAAHRLPRPARQLPWKGHHEWPGQATSCPGAMLQDYKACW